MMQCIRNPDVRCGTLVTLFFLFLLGTGESAFSCSDGWDSYSEDTPYTCFREGDSNTWSLDSAGTACTRQNASLLMFQTDKKYQFFKDLVNISQYTSFWMPLKFIGDRPHWITEDGTVLATLPEELKFYNRDIYGSYSSYLSNNKGFVYKSGALYIPSRQNYYRHGYVCEIPFPPCSSGYFGAECDHECHCHGHVCDPTDPEGLCQFGCQVGWMRSNCSQKKEDADVKYFCVNSADQGKYAHVMIDTKGVHYENIHDQKNLPWCNNTEVNTDKLSSIETIKIYIESSSDDEIKNGKCAGKITADGHYEWMIKIQEKNGLVSRNDQLVHVECDFSNGDTFAMSGSSAIKREKWFRRNDIKRPTEYLEETKEILDLRVVDPFTGSAVFQNLIGSPVVLKIRYGTVEGNVATGVLPFNCDATTPDGKQTTRLLDKHGCHVEGSPVSEFFTNGSKSLITKSFPLFGFDDNKNIEFHCSYILCFGNENCSKDCNHPRHRRSPRITEYRLRGSVEVIPSNDTPVLNLEPEGTKKSSAGRGLSKLDYIFLLPLTVIALAFVKFRFEDYII